MIQIVPVTSKAQQKEFIHFPWKVYKGNPHWVPPLISDMKKMLKPDFPFYEYGTLQLFLAYRGKELVGRVGASLNPLYEQHHEKNVGFFGFFECINDQAVANALLKAAEDWLREKGMTKVHGPTSPSSTYEYGLLVEGFDDAPRIMMAYNPPYYQQFIENYGFTKVKQLYAYKMTAEGVMQNEKLRRGVEAAKKRYNIRIQPIDIPNLKDEIKKLKFIYNEGWENNWGHVPFTDKEIDMVAYSIKPVADNSLIFFVYVNEELAGMVVAVRDINYIIQKIDGKLFPLGWYHLLFNKKLRNQIKWMRVILLGLLPKFRGRAIDAVMYYELIRAGLELGCQYGEGSWILEDNDMMNRGMQAVNGEIYKRYNVYEKPLV